VEQATETQRHRGRHPRITRITRITNEKERPSHAAALRRQGPANAQKRKPNHVEAFVFLRVRRTGLSAGIAGRRATRASSVSLCLCGSYISVRSAVSVSLLEARHR